MNKIANKRITSNLINDLNDELIFQHKKWGIQDHENFKWLAIVTEELGEAAQEILEIDFLLRKDIINIKSVEHRRELLRAELIQVAASAISFIECLDRKVDKRSDLDYN